MSQNEKLFSKWSSAFDSARHKLLAIRRKREREPKVSVNHRLIDGKIEAYEMPLDPHGLVQAKLTAIMDNWSVRLRVIIELDVIVDTRSVCRPDICVRPLNRHQPQSSRAVNSSGNPYSTLVVEIGNTESLNSLHELTAKYFSQRTTIQIYLAIKLYPTRQDEYQIDIPTVLLFNDVPGGVPGGVPNNYIIDLWRLQDAILTI
ncbi:11142_t:CDS:2 [Ambispora gerdemannii]|uniref:11142_t:CDS:1 n=1 Tax=Ambispora gerdemannii TaxID=144530 RepID=A0A9N9D1Q1_9GLOM|nr:11142_t:CDS:2 [Ambispora gerdemannii]